MVNAQNRTLGVILDRGGNGGIVLLNNQGRPSVTLFAGQAGFVEVNAMTGPEIKVNGPSGKDGVVLSATDSSATVKARDGVALTADNNGGHVSILDSKSILGVKMETSAGGGRIVGYDKSKASLFELSGKDSEGVFSLFKKDSEAGFQAWGSGSAIIKKNKETLWKIPEEK